MNNLVSIVLPVYNGAKYLKKSIDSIIKQTYKNWELLILDDCSTDETPLISEEYVKSDDRIKYFRNEHNLKLPGNLNRGFSLSKGDYLTWTSDDNKFHTTAIEKMVTALQNSNNAQFVYASYNTIDENDNITDYYIVDKDYKNIIVGSNCIGACFMYTRAVYEKIGDYDLDLFLTEDFDYWQRILANFEAVSIKEILYDYRKHGANLSSTMKKEKFYTAYKKMLLKNLPSFGKLNIKQKFFFYNALNTCEKCLKSDGHKKVNIKSCFYSFLYSLIYIAPKKFKRIFKKITNSKTK